MIYRCLNCKWQGEDIIYWEEKPRDEFTVMCPKCKHTDDHIQVLKDGEWGPAVIRREPSKEERECTARFYENIAKLMKFGNVYIENKEEKE